MIEPHSFFATLQRHNVNFFTGVPDSLLKNICAYISDNSQKNKHIISTNEGSAIALATGYNIATGNIPLVYMQNSGIGNSINPLLSLADSEVYSIPMILLIGWRGEPGVSDEPQHIKQGKVTLSLLESMGIPYSILESDSDYSFLINEAVKEASKLSAPYAIVVKSGTFNEYKLASKMQNDELKLTREAALEIIMSKIEKEALIISTTGKLSRELFELREKNFEKHNQDFLTVGSMGHANQIALGIAIEKPERMVYCLDGDGAALMHTGALGIIGNISPQNYKHIIFNNGAHDSVGGQPTIGLKTDFPKIANAFKYSKSLSSFAAIDLGAKVDELKKTKGPVLLEILIKKGARKELGRPTISPVENKKNFMHFH
jgi:phosphonopyruvate decarboxylase